MDKINFGDYLQIEILKILMGTPFPLTSHSLAKTLKVSAQNIRKNVHHINDVLKDFDISIHSKSGMGYVYQSTNLDHDKHLRSSIFDSLIYDKRITQDKFVREHLIIRHLIMSEKIVTPNELAESFYISRTTLFRDLERAKETMGNTYNIELIVEPYQGIEVKGSEISLRMMLGREFSFYNDDNLLYVLCDLLLIEPIQPEIFYNFIRKDLKVSVSSNRLYSLYIHLFIMLARQQMGRKIKENDIKTPEYVDNGSILKIRNFLSYHYPEMELENLELSYYLLLIKGISRNINEIQTIDTELHSNINKSLNSVSKEFNLDFSILNSNITFYSEVESLIIRSKQAFISSNFNDKIIKRKSPFCIEIAYRFLKKLRKYLDLNITDMDYYSLALLIYNYLDIDSLFSRRKAIVYSGYSIENSRKLIQSLRNRFPMIEFVYMNEVSDDLKIDTYDFVLSDRHINFNHSNQPVIKIQHFITENDHLKIEKVYREFIEERCKEIEVIQINRQFTSRKSVLCEIMKINTNLLCENEKNDCISRDNELTLEIHNGIAIICTATNDNIKSSIYNLKYPVMWRYSEVNRIFVLNLNNFNGMKFNEWELFINREIEK